MLKKTDGESRNALQLVKEEDPVEYKKIAMVRRGLREAADV
jgi:hypothetical protein